GQGKFTDSDLREVFAIGWMGIGPSTYSLANVLANVQTKLALNAFSGVGVVWDSFCRTGTDLTDFKTASRVRVTSQGTFKLVAPGAEVEHGGLQDTGYNQQAQTYAELIAIDRKDLINDDLNVLTTTPRILGRQEA